MFDDLCILFTSIILWQFWADRKIGYALLLFLISNALGTCFRQDYSGRNQ